MGHSRAIPESHWLLSTSSSSRPPTRWQQRLHYKDQILARLDLERGHRTARSAQLQVGSHQDQMEESGELSCAMKEGALGTQLRRNEGGEDAEELQRRRQGFLYQLNHQCQGAGRSAKWGARAKPGRAPMKRGGMASGTMQLCGGGDAVQMVSSAPFNKLFVNSFHFKAENFAGKRMQNICHQERFYLCDAFSSR